MEQSEQSEQLMASNCALNNDIFIQYNLRIEPTILDAEFTKFKVTNNFGHVLFDGEVVLTDTREWNDAYMRPMWRYQYQHSIMIDDDDDKLKCDTITILVYKNTHKIYQINVYIETSGYPIIEYCLFDGCKHMPYMATIKFV